MTADKTSIPCWGVVNRTIRSGKRLFPWKFLQAAVAFPILGSDFLGAFNLKVNVRGLQLEHSGGRWSVKMTAPPPGSTFAAIGAQLAEQFTSDPSPKIQFGPGEVRKGPPPPGEGPAHHLVPRIPKAGEDQVVPAKSLKIRLLSGERRATVKKPSNSLSKEYRDFLSKRRPSAEEEESSAPSSQKEGGAGKENRGESSAQPPAARAGAAAASRKPPAASSGVSGGQDGLVGAAVGRPDYDALMAKYPTVLNPSKELPPTKHHVQHFIVTEGNPVAGRYRRLDPDRLRAAKAEFAALERQGIVRRSKSHWAAPLHMVKKGDGSWRCCGDFRQLNLQTRPDRYTCPNLADLSADLAGCRVFSKLDLRKGYHQVPVSPQDVEKTAVVTPFGLFEYL
ncbi:MAG: hypothetical protein FJ333_06695, partial [Sphingomonadales bacterium]|nr:hypothetical protein [Sphingomonadales bacterium]